MKKDFVYFFKHNDIDAIKIGKTSGDSVLDRFNAFRTYAPYGAEIIGFFETDNGHRDEKELHQLFKSHRLQGEFFNISLDIVKNIIYEKNADYHKAYTIFNEWIANDQNNYVKLISVLEKVNITDIEKKHIISNNIIDYIKNNFQLDIWYQFKSSYDNLIDILGNNDISNIAFKKNLEYYSKINGFELIEKRKGTDKNRNYFKFL
jgi:tetratricopeptide (TPR) repeat protein